MTVIDGFAPIVSASAKILILGSMPSPASLAKQQYYGHPRNAFWPVMGELIGAGPELTYQRRRQILIAHRIAVWDVLQRCVRPGSADANIDMNTIEVNDFTEFFNRHRKIATVFFNGAAAANVFRKRVLPTFGQHFGYLQYRRLPSTSPAHAGMTLQQKIKAWEAILEAVVN